MGGQTFEDNLFHYVLSTCIFRDEATVDIESNHVEKPVEDEQDLPDIENVAPEQNG